MFFSRTGDSSPVKPKRNPRRHNSYLSPFPVISFRSLEPPSPAAPRRPPRPAQGCTSRKQVQLPNSAAAGCPSPLPRRVQGRPTPACVVYLTTRAVPPSSFSAAARGHSCQMGACTYGRWQGAANSAGASLVGHTPPGRMSRAPAARARTKKRNRRTLRGRMVGRGQGGSCLISVRLVSRRTYLRSK